MKKLIAIIFLSILLFTSLVLAEPFIVSNPQTDATKFRMRLSADNGVTWGTWSEGNPVSNAMKFDLQPVTPGNYKGEAEAGGNVTVTDSTSNQTSTVFKWSDPAPFVLSIPSLTKPTGTKAVGN